MSTRTFFFCSLPLFIILFAIGCDTMKTQVIQQAGENEDIGEIGTVVITSAEADSSTDESSFGTDEYVINTVTIHNDTLRISVSYSGGCETHQFTLVAEERFMESFPVQLRVSLAHNANGDTCEESITEDHVFDLTPIKEMYQKGYQTDTGTIILRLKDAPPGELAYEF